MNAIENSPNAEKSYEYLFNNENIKALRGFKQTKEVIHKIAQLSVEYGILSQYTALLGVQKYASKAEKERITDHIKEWWPCRRMHTGDKLLPDCIGIKTMTGKKLAIKFNENDKIEDLKKIIEEFEGIPTDQQRFIFAGLQLEDRNTLKDYTITAGAIFHLVPRYCGGEVPPPPYPIRTAAPSENEDLVSVVKEQLVEGYWNDVPSVLKSSSNKGMKDVIIKVHSWCRAQNVNSKKLLATIVCLIFMTKFKKELFETWNLIYLKGLKCLASVSKSFDWDGFIKSF